jgi:hypothetical protein
MDEEQASPIMLDVLLLPRERDRRASFRSRRGRRSARNGNAVVRHTSTGPS